MVSWEQQYIFIFKILLLLLFISFIGKEVVKSAHESFVKAVIDLTNLGYDMNLDFSFCKVLILEKNLTYRYDKIFANSLNLKSFELKVIYIK